MRDGLRLCGRLSWLAFVLAILPGCACVRQFCPDRDLRPCEDGYAETADGWLLGIKRYRPEQPDPGKLPVVLCHGLRSTAPSGRSPTTTCRRSSPSGGTRSSWWI